MLSRRFKTIFVHIPKTAGQSIEHVFLEKHGLTWATRAPLLLRANDDPAKGPARLAHLYAREYVECGHVSADDFASFFKFAVVRNPYTWIVSQYRFRQQERRAIPMSFHEFVEQEAEAGNYQGTGHNLAPQATFVSDERGKIIVNEIIRFEDLPASFDPMAQRIFGDRVTLPHVNRSKEPDKPAELDAGLRRIVETRYACDFDLFEYARRA
jgi:Sulfotransferase family